MEKLREFRKGKKLTQKEMARKLGVTLSMYEKVEGGRTGVSAAFMQKLKTAFPDVSIDFLFFAANSNISAV